MITFAVIPCLTIGMLGAGQEIRLPNTFDDGKGLPPIISRQTARIVDVHSGDTVVVDALGFRKRVSVHLWGLAAPVKGQKFFAESRDNLRRLIGGKEVVIFAVDSNGVDSVEAFIEYNNPEPSLFLLQHFSQGLVWWDRIGASGWKWAEGAEALVRGKRVGIWSEPKPVEPRVFRLRQLINSRDGGSDSRPGPVSG